MASSDCRTRFADDDSRAVRASSGMADSDGGSGGSGCGLSRGLICSRSLSIPPALSGWDSRFSARADISRPAWRGGSGCGLSAAALKSFTERPGAAGGWGSALQSNCEN